MRLEAYPRPDNDSGLGFLYSPDARHYSRDDLQRFLPELRAMSASWLTLLATPSLAVPEFFLRELLSHGIEPVVGIVAPPDALPAPAELRPQLRVYAEAGLHYVFFSRHPNMMASWSTEAWLQPDLGARFATGLLPAIATAQEAGLVPLLPPLYPGGDFADIAFLEAELDTIAAQRPGSFDRIGIAIASYAFGRPLTWGKGGPDRWPDAHPYLTPPGTEDHCGFRLGEWYDTIVRRRFGYSLPLIAIEGGSGAPQTNGAASPDAEAASAIACAVAAGDPVDAVFCVSLGLLSSGDDARFEAAAYCKADGSRAEAATSLRALPRQRRRFAWEAAPKSPALPQTKPLYHYLLLPKLEPTRSRSRILGHWGTSDEWRTAEAYIRRFRPACGFSPEEAANAEFVTIVGDGLGISPTTERLLRAAGCKVERIAGVDSRETKRQLDALAKEGRRFASF